MAMWNPWRGCRKCSDGCLHCYIHKGDARRGGCWKMIRQRQDCTFLFLTKRIDRFMNCIPDDWGNGYENVVVCCTIENQENVDYKLNIFKDLPIKHKCITAQPLIEAISLEKYLVGGESDRNARHLPAPLRPGIFGPNSLNVARYAAFIWAKSPTMWDAQLAESNFKTRSSG